VAKLFRKISLERLASPEELDIMMRVTTPKGWLALLGIGVLIIIASIWSIYGSIPEKVTGSGLFIKSGGVFDVVSLTSGQLLGIYANVEGIVDKAQIIAKVAQPELKDQISELERNLIELKSEHIRMEKNIDLDIKMQKEHMKNQLAHIIRSIEFWENRLKWLKEKKIDQTQLLTMGLITEQTFLNTMQEINSAMQQIEKDQNQIKEIKIREFQLRDNKKRELVQSQQLINKQQRKLDALMNSLELKSRVLSPFTGRVIEIKAEPGKLISSGESILTLELIGESTNDLEVVVYVAPTEGKKVNHGMKAQISPSIVKQEEYGYILGMVTHVAEFPSTIKGMMRVLQNNSLVQTLSSKGAPIEIYVDLIPDSETKSGFKWSSPKGDTVTVQSGTLCNVTFTISEKAPISLVIPLFKKYLLGIGNRKLML